MDDKSIMDGLQWLIAAVLLACATVGPKIIGPLLDNWANSRKPKDIPVTSPAKVIGLSLEGKHADNRLVEAIERLCDILEKHFLEEEKQTAEMKMKKYIADLLEKLPKDGK